MTSMITREIQFVASDGTYHIQGLRVRTGSGNGAGSIYDEFKRGVRTPLAGDKGKKMLLSCISNLELKAFIHSLPIARTVRVTDLEEADAN